MTHDQRLVDAILAHGGALAANDQSGVNGVFTRDSEADRLLMDDPFAFLIGVIVDYQMPAERAWILPHRLKLRLRGWGPTYLAEHADEVVAAFAEPPKLHRFPNQTPRFVVAGISQKKAAMAVELLERDLGVTVRELGGSDVAYDVHLRRVMLRTGLAERDAVDHMVAVARVLHPERPGELDFPLWDIGRSWCHKTDPQCAPCVLADVCPRDIAAGDVVRGA